MTRIEAEIWCPSCKETMGRILADQQGEDHWVNRTEPPTLGKRCSRCSTVLERKVG